MTRPDNIPEEDWAELTTREKLDRISGKDDMPEGWIDWNAFSLDWMADYLEQKYRFLSSGEALCIFKLIEFYRKHKECPI